MPISSPEAAPLPARVRIAPDVLHERVEGRVVMLDLQGERYYSLDDVGTRIWTLLAEQVEVESICERLLEVYDVNEAKLRQDVAAFIDRLARQGLITIAT